MTYRANFAAAGLACALILSASLASAEGYSLLGSKAFLQDRAPQSMVMQASATASGKGAPSLFRGRDAGIFFERRARGSVVSRPPNDALATPIPAFGSQADRVRHLIARAEAGRDGYDAVQHGARRRPHKKPTAMTIAEIDTWIRATPGQPHAIGRYQFIPATLRRLVGQAGIRPQERFTPDLQDRLGDMLLAEAGYAEAASGRLSRHAFMNNLAKIWAGLPNSTGKSHYQGYAGNAATMTWARFDAEMERIFRG